MSDTATTIIRKTIIRNQQHSVSFVDFRPFSVRQTNIKLIDMPGLLVPGSIAEKLTLEDLKDSPWAQWIQLLSWGRFYEWLLIEN